MAAVFLHNAIIAAEPPTPPPTVAQHAPPSTYAPSMSRATRVPHNRTLSSVSSVTLHTLPGSDNSHPTEPLMHPGDSGSTVYLELLARQPTHPSTPRRTAGPGLTLQGDPVTARERRVQRERAVRRRLRRLRWAQRALWAVVGEWNAVSGGQLRTTRSFICVSCVCGDRPSWGSEINTAGGFGRPSGRDAVPGRSRLSRMAPLLPLRAVSSAAGRLQAP